MPLFLCRWPNGDWSVVLASNEQDALIKLDEIANAEECPLVQLDAFQVHFHLTDDGELLLDGFGETTEEEISDICYPVLDEVKGQVQMEPDGRPGWLSGPAGAPASGRHADMSSGHPAVIPTAFPASWTQALVPVTR
jgi:hypothetical protein